MRFREGVEGEEAADMPYFDDDDDDEEWDATWLFVSGQICSMHQKPSP